MTAGDKLINFKNILNYKALFIQFLGLIKSRTKRTWHKQQDNRATRWQRNGYVQHQQHKQENRMQNIYLNAELVYICQWFPNFLAFDPVASSVCDPNFNFHASASIQLIFWPSNICRLYQCPREYKCIATSCDPICLTKVGNHWYISLSLSFSIYTRIVETRQQGIISSFIDIIQ